MKNIKLLPIFVLLLALAGKNQAQEVRKSLKECIDIALQNNLTVKAGKSALERAKVMQGTAFSIDKTQFTLSQDPTSGGSPDNAFSISQSFDFPTVYVSRYGLLKAETNLEKSNLELTRNELVRQVSAVYEQLLYAAEKVRVLQAQDSIFQKFVFLATTKFRSGETGRLEQMNAERLHNENRIALQQAEKDYQSVQLALQRRLNTGDLINPAETALHVLENPFAAGEFNPAQNPVNKVFESKKLIGEKSLSLAKQGFLPGINFALRSQYLLKGYNPYNIDRKLFAGGNQMGFEVGVDIPLFFGEQMAKAKAARREVEILKTQQEDALLSLAHEYQMALNEYEKAKKALDYYLTQGNAIAEEIGRITQTSYEQGEIGYIEYIQNLKSTIELHLQYAEAVNAYNQAVIGLKYLQGTAE
ncbi:MAG: TolC family protein [Dysgonamonadaceae bacterium]|jgi:cobalt-zinc-cadmium resistance protein CzcA|nr:TolC family protein [Dysgonamonadaceae bacterium]